jgi:predicted amidohydrolase
VGKGPLKEHHWATLLAARAGYDLLCRGGRGTKNIGQSRVVDPLGVTIAAAAEARLLVAEINIDRIALARQQLPVLRNRRFAPPQLL